MLVHGAIIPPRSVLEAVAAVIGSVPEPAVPAPPPPSSKGLLSRVGRHRAAASAATEAEPEPTPMLERVSVASMRMPITGFGNLTTHDAHRLVAVLKEAAAGWPVPVASLLRPLQPREPRH